MTITPTDVDAIAAALRNRIPPPWAEAVARGDAADLLDAAGTDAYRQWYRDVARTGVVAPRWPIRGGGLGLDGEDAVAVERVLEALGVVRLGGFELARLGPVLASWGTDEQIADHLPGILDGSVSWCQLFSEPGAGSDLPSLATTATKVEDGWRIRGQKVWASGANTARFGLLLARTSPERPKRQGVSGFIIDMTATGIDVRPLRQMTGDAAFCEVFLDDVVVDDRARLGPVDGGWTIARTVLAGERRGISGAGAGERMPFDATVDHATLKLLGGRRDDAARLYSLDKVHAWRNARLASVAGPGWASLGKLAQSELNQYAHNLFVDAVSARVIACAEDDVEALDRRYMFLRSRANTIEGGTSEIHRDTVAEQVLGLPRLPDPFRSAPWKDVPR